MNVTRKSAGTPYVAGTAVRVPNYSPLPDTYVIAEVVWIERGANRFDTYRLATQAGDRLDRVFYRSDIRPA